MTTANPPAHSADAPFPALGPLNKTALHLVKRTRAKYTSCPTTPARDPGGVCLVSTPPRPRKNRLSLRQLRAPGAIGSGSVSSSVPGSAAAPGSGSVAAAEKGHKVTSGFGCCDRREQQRWVPLLQCHPNVARGRCTNPAGDDATRKTEASKSRAGGPDPRIGALILVPIAPSRASPRRFLKIAASGMYKTGGEVCLTYGQRTVRTGIKDPGESGPTNPASPLILLDPRSMALS
jgi:hypothetical protein